MITQFPPIHIEINPKLVYQLLGYRKKTAAVPEKIIASVNSELALSIGLLRFKGVYAKFRVQVFPDKVELENGYIVNSAKFAAWVNDCSEIYLFAVTAGALFSERIMQLLKDGDVSRALIADAVGSAAAECCAEAADNYIRNLETGKTFTKRFSPGYSDWNVADNRILVSYLQTDRIGLTVNDKGLMIPEKSVSAAIGVKPGTGNWRPMTDH